MKAVAALRNQFGGHAVKAAAAAAGLNAAGHANTPPPVG